MPLTSGCNSDTQGRFLICELFVRRWWAGKKGGQSLSSADILSPLPLELISQLPEVQAQEPGSRFREREAAEA